MICDTSTRNRLQHVWMVFSSFHQSSLLCGYEPVVLQNPLRRNTPTGLLFQGSWAPTEPECCPTHPAMASLLQTILCLSCDQS